MNEVIYSIETLDFSVIRSLVWEAMKSKWKQQYDRPLTYSAGEETICWSVVDLAIQKKYIPNPSAGYIQHSKKLSSQSHKAITEVLWELVLQGILYVDSLKSGIYNITQFGLQVLDAEEPIPYDPDGYLGFFKSELPDIDEVMFSYISEAINAYRHRLFLSATTAIGCASEKALLLLIEAYTGFLPSRKEQESFARRTSGRFIKTQFEEFQKSLGGQMGRIDKELLDGIDIVINGVFELLRQNRNSTGHPTGKAMSQESVFASLQVFVIYCKRIYALIAYLKANTTPNV